jgi:hypothetical protein
MAVLLRVALVPSEKKLQFTCMTVKGRTCTIREEATGSLRV